MVALALLFTVLVSSSPARAGDGFKRTHTVRKGETLKKIAKRYKVTIKKLQRWNKMRKRTMIRAGQKLVVFSKIPQHNYRRVTYVVKGGDSPIRIAKRMAKRHGLKYPQVKKLLLRYNRAKRKRLKKGKVIPGEKLYIMVRGPKKQSKSTGKPHTGRLIDGERLQDGYGYWVRSQKKSWADNKTVRILTKVLPRVRRRWPKSPDIMVGDLSLEGGGRMRPHASHQNGLDADIAYYHKTDRKKKRPKKGYKIKSFKVATAKTLDARKTWFLFKALMDTGEVDYIFVDYSLLKPLYDEARRSWPMPRNKRKARRVRRKRDDWLKRNFQYPRPRANTQGTIRHCPSHRNHFHIRFMPPE